MLSSLLSPTQLYAFPAHLGILLIQQLKKLTKKFKELEQCYYQYYSYEE
jgi:hypothetical protein